MTKIQKSFDANEVGMRIRYLRKQKSLKQDDLSEVLGGLSRSQISNIETGRRNINLHQIKALADFFGVSIEALGLKSDEIETNDLLERAKVIFTNESVPIEEKQDLYEEIMKLYLFAKQEARAKK